MHVGPLDLLHNLTMQCLGVFVGLQMLCIFTLHIIAGNKLHLRSYSSQKLPKQATILGLGNLRVLSRCEGQTQCAASRRAQVMLSNTCILLSARVLN